MVRKGKHKNQQEQQFKPKNKHIITEDYLMDKSHMFDEMICPLLPSESIYPDTHINNTHVIRSIVTNINYLQYVNFKTFWTTLMYNMSFKNTLSTCLTYLHRQCLNIYIYQKPEKQYYQQIKDQQYFELTEALTKLILFTYYRIINHEQQNSQLSKFYHLGDYIYKKYIIDLPKILQMIEIYGSSNPTIISIIVKFYCKNSDNFYQEFIRVVQFMGQKLMECAKSIKKITDRQQFGINYSYKRNQPDQLSPGEVQLTKKIKILVEILTIQHNLKHMIKFLPKVYSQQLQYYVNLHIPLQNIFYQLQAAYRAWNYHQQQHKILPIINYILQFIIEYFITFFSQCHNILIRSSLKSGVKGSFLKSLQRIFADYGIRKSLGKKAASKRTMVLYKQICKGYDLNQFLEKLQLLQSQQQKYGINIEYLADFKMEVQMVTQIQVNKSQIKDQNADSCKVQQEKNINIKQQKQPIQIEQHKIEQHKAEVKVQKELSQLPVLLSKKNRPDDYYEKMYRKYAKRVQVNYNDDYDDLQEYKKPLFIEEPSSDSDSEREEHLVEDIQYLKKVTSQQGVDRIHTKNKQYLQKQTQQKQTQQKQTQQKQTQQKQTQQKQTQQKQTQQKKYVLKTDKEIDKETDKVTYKVKEKYKSDNGQVYNDEPSCKSYKPKAKYEQKQKKYY